MVRKRSWVVGRAPDCDVVVRDPVVSERHCRLTETDAGGNTKQLPLVITIASVAVVSAAPPAAVADTTPPTVSITSPGNGGIVTGSKVTVSATAADNVGVVGVQFLLNGTPIGAEATTAPYTVRWNTNQRGGITGSQALSARARDAAGNVTTSAVVNVVVQ